MLHSTYDEKYCERCDSSTRLLEIDEATQIEIQTFAMVNDGDSSRLAEDAETPAFFDVMVSTSPAEGGEILTLEEHDDMTAKDAARVLAAMIKAYPTVAVSGANCNLGKV